MKDKATYTRHVEMSADEVANLAAWDRAVVRAWHDPEFKQRLVDDPRRALSEMGFQPPKGVHLVIVENTHERRHLVLPAAPTGDLGVEELERSPLHDYDAGF